MKGKPILPKVLNSIYWKIVHELPEESLVLWFNHKSKKLAICSSNGEKCFKKWDWLRVIQYKNIAAFYGSDAHFYFAKVLNKSKERY